jgi:hypothetical protein
MYSKLRGSWSVQKLCRHGSSLSGDLLASAMVATLVSRAASNAYARVDVLSH